MHSFLIQDLPEAITNSADILIVETEASIGIDEVRQIQSFLSRKPSQSEKNIIYVKDAHKLTLAAQNAFLKTLEEPPGNSEIYLITSSPDLLLPTILSRVQISKANSKDSIETDIKDIESIIDKIKSAKAGERLELVDTLSFTRESALEFLDKMELWFHKNLSQKFVTYDSIVEARKYLTANVNVKLTMDKLFLSFKG